MNPRRLEMTVLMTPDMANFSGKVNGGALLNLLDRVAFPARRAEGDQIADVDRLLEGDLVDREGHRVAARVAVPTLRVDTPTEARRSRAAELRREIAAEMERAARGEA
jgi:hypothetical protein